MSLGGSFGRTGPTCSCLEGVEEEPQPETRAPATKTAAVSAMGGLARCVGCATWGGGARGVACAASAGGPWKFDGVAVEVVPG